MGSSLESWSNVVASTLILLTQYVNDFAHNAKIIMVCENGSLS